MTPEPTDRPPLPELPRRGRPPDDHLADAHPLRAPSPEAPTLARRVPLAVWYGLTLVALAVTANRWGSQLIAWVAPVTLLVLARRVGGWRQWALAALVVTLGTMLQVGKIVTEPITPLIAPLFAIPTALGTLAVMALYRVAWRRGGELAALYAFPALAALSEWLSFAQSELGVWGTSANSQLDNLPLLQLASLTGVAGIGFLMSWVAAALAAALDAPAAGAQRFHLAAPFVALLAANLWGSARVHAVSTGPTVQVAGVVTDVGLSNDIPSRDVLAKNEDELFARTATGAARGAQLVVWNEAATLVEPDDEARLVARAQQTAAQLGVDLVMAYAVIESRAPMRFMNRYAWISAQGAVLETYDKHHPVPGEPSIKGTAPIRTLDRPWGRSAGAICYDYDFPALGREHARLGASLVVIPSSDWKGIDPYHTQATRVRAIEGGFSVVRPVRWATSAAYDPWGRVRGSLSAWEDNDRVFVAAVPVTRVSTLYAKVGDWPVLALSMTLLLWAVLRSVVGARAPRPESSALPRTEYSPRA